jgi:2-methylcitrate dehydratase PrpD
MIEARAALPPGTSHHDVVEIHLASHRPGMTHADPPTSLAAKFSFAHVLATVLVHGHADQAAFSASVLDDPDIARLRHAVTLTRFEPALPRPHDRPARLRLVLRDGRQVDAQCLSARGGPDRPWEPGVIENKIHQLTRPLSPRLADTLLELTELPTQVLQRPWPEVLENALR